MAENKTKATTINVSEFLAALNNPTQQVDCERIIQLMQKISKEKPVIWGANMIGFGHYSYTYASGHGGEFFRIGFAPRKSQITLYLMSNYTEKYPELMSKLGKFKSANSCLHIKNLAAIDIKVLEELIKESYLNHIKQYK